MYDVIQLIEKGKIHTKKKKKRNEKKRESSEGNNWWILKKKKKPRTRSSLAPLQASVKALSQ